MQQVKIELSIKGIADTMGVSIKKLAELTDIKYDRLLNINNGRGVMSAKEMKVLSEVSGLPASNIKA